MIPLPYKNKDNMENSSEGPALCSSWESLLPPHQPLFPHSLEVRSRWFSISVGLSLRELFLMQSSLP